MTDPNSYVGKHLGEFEIIRELGRGGMGIVYEARQRSLDRPVALKVLPTGLGMTAGARERFHREAQAAAKLQHTHIVAVFAEGEEDGTCYYAMELVKGVTLDSKLGIEGSIATTVVKRSTESAGQAATPAKTPAKTVANPRETFLTSGRSLAEDRDWDQIAGWIADVAEALEYAHQQGVVHRDVKPSNIMLGDDGRVRLLDFGLARIVQEPGMTVSGEMVGTPRYMSPEQIAAGRSPIDQRTDVYSLGATLYELLTASPLFPGDSRDQMITQILHEEPMRPRSRDSEIPVDLETICLKAVEKNPELRYPTASEMAADLRRYCAREEIAAKRTTPLIRGLRWVQRHPALVAMWALILIAVVVAAVSGQRMRALSQRRLLQLRETAVAETMRGNFGAAEEAMVEARRLGAKESWSRLLRGQAELRRGNVNEALRLFEQIVREDPQDAAAQAALHYAYLVSNNPAKYAEGIGVLKTLPMTSFEDFLFSGQAIARSDLQQGLEWLDEANRRRRSAFGYQTSAEVRLYHAWAGNDLELAERAVRDATIAAEMLENPLEAACIRVLAHIAAAKVHQNAGRATAAAEQLEAASDVDVSLGGGDLRGLPTHFLAQGFLHDVLNQRQEALAFYQRVGESDHLFALRQSVYAHYRLGQYAQSLAVCDHIAEWASGEVELAKAFLLIDTHGAEAALQRFRDLTAKTAAAKLSFFPAVSYAEISQLVGRDDLAQSYLLDVKDQLVADPLESDWCQAELRFLTGQIDSESLLEIAGDSLFRRMHAHYAIGLQRLGNGDRAAALGHFQEAADAGMPPHPEWYWASAFAARLKTEPDWPPQLEAD